METLVKKHFTPEQVHDCTLSLQRLPIHGGRHDPMDEILTARQTLPRNHHGILAVIDGPLQMSEEQFDEDYAIRVVAKVKQAILQFYTDLEHDSVDE